MISSFHPEEREKEAAKREMVGRKVYEHVLSRYRVKAAVMKRDG